jgi:hypothetical protein
VCLLLDEWNSPHNLKRDRLNENVMFEKFSAVLYLNRTNIFEQAPMHQYGRANVCTLCVWHTTTLTITYIKLISSKTKSSTALQATISLSSRIEIADRSTRRIINLTHTAVL